MSRYEYNSKGFPLRFFITGILFPFGPSFSLFSIMALALYVKFTGGGEEDFVHWIVHAIVFSFFLAALVVFKGARSRQKDIAEYKVTIDGNRIIAPVYKPENENAKFMSKLIPVECELRLDEIRKVRLIRMKELSMEQMRWRYKADIVADRETITVNLNHEEMHYIWLCPIGENGEILSDPREAPYPGKQFIMELYSLCNRKVYWRVIQMKLGESHEDVDSHDFVGAENPWRKL